MRKSGAIQGREAGNRDGRPKLSLSWLDNGFRGLGDDVQWSGANASLLDPNDSVDTSMPVIQRGQASDPLDDTDINDSPRKSQSSAPVEAFKSFYPGYGQTKGDRATLLPLAEGAVAAPAIKFGATKIQKYTPPASIQSAVDSVKSFFGAGPAASGAKTSAAAVVVSTTPGPNKVAVPVSTPAQAVAVAKANAPSASPQVQQQAAAAILTQARQGKRIYENKKKSSSLPWIIAIGALSAGVLMVVASSMSDD